MKTLSRDAFERAREFIRRSARPLDRNRFARSFEGAGSVPVLQELARYRNDDGGFGRSLEPDLRCPSSSVIATTCALQVLRELGAPASQPLVQGAIAHLVQAYDPEIEGWRLVPREVDDHPHASHWDWAAHAGGERARHVNPGAEVLAHFCHYRELAPSERLEELAGAIAKRFEAARDSIGPDGLLCVTRLIETPGCPAAVREALVPQVRETGLAMVNRSPEDWKDYVAKPLKLAPAPEATLAEALHDEVQVNLDYEVEHQNPDGSWSPNWSWRGAYPDAWKVARREWQGSLSLSTLESLRAWGRLAR